jgi:hypothetical protein
MKIRSVVFELYADVYRHGKLQGGFLQHFVANTPKSTGKKKLKLSL